MRLAVVASALILVTASTLSSALFAHLVWSLTAVNHSSESS